MDIYITLLKLITNLIQFIISFCFSSVLYLILYDYIFFYEYVIVASCRCSTCAGFKICVTGGISVRSAALARAGCVAAYRWSRNETRCRFVVSNTTRHAFALLCGWFKGAGHFVRLTVFRLYAQRSVSTSRSARHLTIPRYSLNSCNTHTLRHSYWYWYRFVLAILCFALHIFPLDL